MDSIDNKISQPKNNPRNKILVVVCIVLISALFGFLGGAVSTTFSGSQIKNFLEKFQINIPQASQQQNQQYVPQTTEEEKTISAVRDVSPSVVSIIISKDLPVLEQYYINPFEQFGAPFDFQIPQYRQKGTEKKEIGGGTGFIISEDGMVITNRHVVEDTEADYTVLTNDGQKYPAKVVARDSVQDLAIIKIQDAKTDFKVVKLGDSSGLQIGQTVIAIGNALGEFRNTVSVGVISGLGRTVTASGGSSVETLQDIIQTDAAINAGNSGGPLLNLKGEVIGIDTAMATGAQSIGFAIPINKAKKDIESVKASGKIVYPFLGVRYVLITSAIQKDNNLAVDYGAWIQPGSNKEPAVTSGSAADKAGLKEGDIILEFNAKKITSDNSLANMIMDYNPGDKITLKILRKGEEKTIEATLGERSE